jgi:hypothetical protein
MERTSNNKSMEIQKERRCEESDRKGRVGEELCSAIY